MRKAIVVLLAGLVLVVAFAAPAFALRDPFDPVVDLTPEAGGGGGGASEPWLVVAYGLIAVGAAAVVLSKTFTPVRLKR